jgi:hypothetical protein
MPVMNASVLCAWHATGGATVASPKTNILERKQSEVTFYGLGDIPSRNFYGMCTAGANE